MGAVEELFISEIEPYRSSGGHPSINRLVVDGRATYSFQTPYGSFHMPEWGNVTCYQQDGSRADLLSFAKYLLSFAEIFVGLNI